MSPKLLVLFLFSHHTSQQLPLQQLGKSGLCVRTNSATFTDQPKVIDIVSKDHRQRSIQHRAVCVELPNDL